jgi:hypothetical protein
MKPPELTAYDINTLNNMVRKKQVPIEDKLFVMEYIEGDILELTDKQIKKLWAIKHMIKEEG